MGLFVVAMGNSLSDSPRQAADMRSSVMDQALAEQAAHAGRMLEAAYANSDRELALIWKDTMYAIVKLRHARRFGSDTHAAEGAAR